MRLSKTKYFMEIAKLSAERSTCVSRHVGAVIVKGGHVLATSYNGAPSGVKHCTKETCLRKGVKSGEKLWMCMGAHAEINAIVQCALYGVSTVGSTMYCTNFPCSFCLKAIINAQIKTLYYLEDYYNPLSKLLLKDIDMKIIKLED